MTIKYTYSENRLPESKMRRYATKVINIIGGPGSAKSMSASAVFLNLCLRGKSVERIPDLAKTLVWQQNYEALEDQYHLAQKQNQMLELLDGQLQYLVVEGSLPQLLFYNEYHPENISDVAKTRRKILAWYKQYNNINLFINRDERPYIQHGRFQNEEQAKKIDKDMRYLLSKEGITYTPISADVVAISAFVKNLE